MSGLAAEPSMTIAPETAPDTISWYRCTPKAVRRTRLLALDWNVFRRVNYACL